MMIRATMKSRIGIHIQVERKVPMIHRGEMTTTVLAVLLVTIVMIATGVDHFHVKERGVEVPGPVVIEVVTAAETAVVNEVEVEVEIVVGAAAGVEVMNVEGITIDITFHSYNILYLSVTPL